MEQRFNNKQRLNNNKKNAQCYIQVLRVFLGSPDKYRGQLRAHPKNLGTAKPCLEGNTHRLADVGNRGQAQRSPR